MGGEMQVFLMILGLNETKGTKFFRAESTVYVVLRNQWWKGTYPTSERIDWIRKTQAIKWLYKLFGNFHSSTVLLCLCAQEESHGRRMSQSPLAEPPLPLPPAPPRDVSLLARRARDEPVRIGAREPGSFPGAGLWIVPHMPGSGRAEDGPPHLLLQRASFPHAVRNKAGADMLTQVSLAVRDKMDPNWTEQRLRSQWACSFRGRALQLLYAWLALLLWCLWAELFVASYLCLFLCDCAFERIWKNCAAGEAFEDRQSRKKSGRWHTRTLLHDCTAALRVTELNSAAHCPLHWFLFTYPACWTGLQFFRSSRIRIIYLSVDL